MNSPTHMIAFDLFGVVISDGHMVSNGLMPLLPVGTAKAQVKPWYDRYTEGQIEEIEFWRGIGFDTVPTALRQQFLHSFELDAELQAVTSVLSSDYRLAVLSNLASDWGDVLRDRFCLDKLFSPIILSGEVGSGKPDPAIYQALLDSSGLAAENITFIDDRLENLAVAHQLGMQTIHYQREFDDNPFAPGLTISRLREILPWFGIH